MRVAFSASLWTELRVEEERERDGEGERELGTVFAVSCQTFHALKAIL